MKNLTPKDIETLERFNTHMNQRVIILVVYILAMLILKEGFGTPFSYIAFLAISFMILSSLPLMFYLDHFFPRGKTILTVNFFYVMLDLLCLTIVFYYIGGITWLGFIFYSFYLVLNFMTFPRKQAFFLTIWVLFLYLGLVLFQYFQIFPFFSLFLPGSQTSFHFLYVITTVIAYIATLILIAYYTRGFYQLYFSKALEFQKVKEILEKENASLEKRVESRKKELTKEKETLQERIERRKKELEQKEMTFRERAEELERFKKIVLGREEKLEELQKELNILQRKLKP